MIPIAKPLIGQDEIDGVISVMRSGNIAEGPRVKEFESLFADYVGARHAIAVNSGTAALHVALLASGISKGDEVITTPFTFIATANAVLYAGAKPVFADIEPDTFNIDPADIERKITEKTRAIIPVDLYGHPANMKAIMKIANDHGIKVIEDACQAHGSDCGGKKCGSFDTGCFSFYPTKNMTTSEGGMITTSDDRTAEIARMIRSHGSKVRYYHQMLGYNLRMTDISAAIGLAQLRKVDYYDERRIENSELMSEKLQGKKGIVTPIVRPNCRHVFHQYTIRVTEDLGMSRDEVVTKLGEAGIGTSVYYPLPIHMQPYYKELGYQESHPVAEQMAKEVLSLPIHPSITEEDIDQIAEAIWGL